METNLLTCWTYFNQDQSDCRNREGYYYPFNSPNSDTTPNSGITRTEIFLKHLVHRPQTAILSLTQTPTHNYHKLACIPQVIHREKQSYTRSLKHTPDFTSNINPAHWTRTIIIELRLMASKKKKTAAVKSDETCVQKFNMVLQYGVRLLQQPPYYNSGITRIENFLTHQART